ncbi:MAG: OPT/YSL family transporter, partial [Bacteriovoracia bacterium]
IENLTFAFQPSLLLVGVGGIMGIRAAASLMFGAILAWFIVGPQVLELGWASPGTNNPDASWYSSMINWLLWPGVAMMVTSSLTSFAFSWKSIMRSFSRKTPKANLTDNTSNSDEIPKKIFLILLASVMILSVTLQNYLFDIALWIAIFGVFVTFLLAIVAGRVSGETAITPVGAMGKVTQLMFGVLAPGIPAANLMAANVTGGAASQCGDLLHDLKTGHLIGASPRLQSMAQYFGLLSGALIGSAAYLILIPDPVNQLLTDEWPAPAVAAWKAVAEIFQEGLSAMPTGTIQAFIIAGIAGILLAVMEKTVPPKFKAWVPSPASIGLAFVIPAYNAISMFIGAILALLLGHFAKTWTKKFLIVAASGLIAGESLIGVLIAMFKMIFG